jgi:hypothetical protein
MAVYEQMVQWHGVLQKYKSVAMGATGNESVATWL